MIANPSAFLFCNGQARYFHADERPIEDLNTRGWKGLHSMLHAFPAADVYLQGTGILCDQEIASLLKNIKQPGKIYYIKPECKEL